MKVLKYFGIAAGIVTFLGLLVFGGIVFMMSSASEKGRDKIRTLESEFVVGTSVDGLIGRAEQLDLNSISWQSEAGKEEFDDAIGVFNADDPAKMLARSKLDFKVINEKFQASQSGNIQLLAYGSMVLERFILSIEFVDRKVTKATVRVID